MALSRAAIVQAAEADPAVPSRAADTVQVAVAVGPAVAAIVREAGAGLEAEATVRAEADPAEGRGDSAEAGRATIAVARSAASV